MIKRCSVFFTYEFFWYIFGIPHSN